MNLYRYTSSAEIHQVISERRIQAKNILTGEWVNTFYTPTRYGNPDDAAEFLALPFLPRHRIGPVSSAEIPAFDIAVRRVEPNFGHMGGGFECRTPYPVWLMGIYDMENNVWNQ